MGDIFPHFRFGKKEDTRRPCKCGHSAKEHRNPKGTLQKHKDRPCQKFGCDCKKFEKT